MCQWFLKVFGLQNGARRPSKRAKSSPNGPRKVLQTPEGTQAAEKHGQERPDGAPKTTKTGQEADNLKSKGTGSDRHEGVTVMPLAQIQTKN